MGAEDSVTRWIEGVKTGDDDAAQALWDRYFQRMVGLARKQLGSVPRRMADEEDVALSAFASFCRAAQRGRFPSLKDRDSLWRLLMSITARKSIDQRRYHASQVHGGGKIKGESAFAGVSEEGDEPGIAQVIGDSPTPEFAAMLAEEFERRLDALKENEHCATVACLKMEGYTHQEIADKLDCSISTVERCVRLIRKKWSRELER